MAKLGEIKQDASEVERPSFQPPADGWYDVQVIASDVEIDWKKKGTEQVMGDRLWVEVQIMNDGPGKGFKFRKYCNTRHKEARQESFGLADFNDLCRSMGFTRGYSEIEDTREMHLKPFRVEIKSTAPDESKGQKYWSTDIKTWGCNEDEKDTSNAPAQSSAPADDTAKENQDWRQQAAG